MNTSISPFPSDLQIGNPTICDNLAIVPLLNTNNSHPDYFTLDEGLDASLFEVEELDGGARVNDILFRNQSDKFALLFEGEEFLGAKQNRILNVSIFVTPKTKQTIPVSCVEAGRWRHQHQSRSKQRFRAANRMHYARGRAFENQAVSASLASCHEYRSDQSGVWKDISLKSNRMKVHSDSSASAAMYVSAESKIEVYLKSFKHTPNQVGSVFLIDGTVSGLELFATEATHRKMIQKLIRSYALDAIDSSMTSSKSAEEPTRKLSNKQCLEATEEFTNKLQSSWTKRFDGVCVGENYRFKDDYLTGSALVHEDRLLHLCAFALDPELSATEADAIH
ncbi:MAG: hypothetical protein OXH31_05905 [Gammaproteobacteria bacterium]|nr:hypothetical protein [Gammaproteobacteria bacterium]